ncbi:MAG: aromatic amino acid ammonia-lyase [Bacteroidales bacterium]|jgi:histidine ammonia-lyase|nr:aromatic amino acid ammonia-lyase [Bacteroidales bacterium]
MTVNDIKEIIFGGKDLLISEEDLRKVSDCFDFLCDFSKDRIIYGINTGFGPMAQYRVSDDYLTELQYNIIRSHSVGAGKPLAPIYVKAAMVARLMTFVQGHSGVHKELVLLLQEFINNNIIPYIPKHGSVGASGDLVQLAHIALTLIGEGEVFYNGTLQPTAGVLQQLGLKPLNIHLREGLAVTNGTAVMTGIGIVNTLYVQKLLDTAILCSLWMNEIANSYDDLMSEELNMCKHHKGQILVAERMRTAAASSKCLLKRENALYNDLYNNNEKIFKHKIQPYYSLRCVPQILGPVYDTLLYCQSVLENELNSADDNPIIDPESKNVYHGGNFHGDYISLEMDKLKIAVTKMTMLMERQMNYLFHDKINEILPPFVNLGVLGLNYGMQAMQFTATSTTAESQTLSNSMYVHSIPNNNDNQDIVSMGTNSALLCKHVVENAFQVMAIHLVALAQATDCLKISSSLSDKTKSLYDDIRAIVPVFIDDTPKYKEIANIIDYLKNI